MRPSVAFGGGGSGSSYDDTALAARVTALEANQLWEYDTAGSDAGPSASVLFTGLHATRRSLVRVGFTQTGATGTGLEFEPDDAAADGDSSWARMTAAGAFGSDSAKALIANNATNNTYMFIELLIDPTNRVGMVWNVNGAGAAPNTVPFGAVTYLQWSSTYPAITSFRLTQTAGSATMTTTSWKIWTSSY